MENNQNNASKVGKRIPKDVKEYILKKIKEGGKTVAEVSLEHGIGRSAIHKWLKNETGGGSPDLQLLKLHKENQLLKQLVAELSLKIRETEKRGW
jgi:transposase-like protein